MVQVGKKEGPRLECPKGLGFRVLRFLGFRVFVFLGFKVLGVWGFRVLNPPKAPIIAQKLRSSRDLKGPVARVRCMQRRSHGMHLERNFSQLTCITKYLQLYTGYTHFLGGSYHEVASYWG